MAYDAFRVKYVGLNGRKRGPEWWCITAALTEWPPVVVKTFAIACTTTNKSGTRDKREYKQAAEVIIRRIHTKCPALAVSTNEQRVRSMYFHRRTLLQL